MNEGFGTPGHLARRFAGSLWPAGPGVGEEAWALRWLTTDEKAVWGRMSGPDRRHAVAVARRAAEAFGNRDGTGVSKAVIVAALLHDSGKIDAGLGPLRRVAATVAALTLGRDAVAGWSKRPSGMRRRAGMYVTHDSIGSAMLARIGSDPLVSTWAGEHHLPAEQWTLARDTAEALKAADDD